MNLKKTVLFVLMIISVAAFSACGGDVSETPDAGNPVPVVPQETNIIADGKLVPKQYAYIPFMNSGKVEEVLVEVGQQVDEGYVLARLERTEQIDLAIEQAQFELLSAERALELAGTKDEPAAEARVTAAERQLAIAEAAPDDLELRAPFSGTIMEVDLYVGQQISSGQNAFLLADLSEWFIETDNLTEIEVVDVRVGQRVTVIPDSLPDVSMAGEVISINSIAEEKRGDVTYTVTISIGTVDPRLRWGMTMAVTFED